MTDILDMTLPWLFGEPKSRGQIRVEPADFIVQEDLGYEPEGEGEHHYLYIRKTGENTDWVARQLANFAQVSPRDVAYAGKKDRHAVTEQWFSVHLPGKRKLLNWSMFGGDTIQVLKQNKHRRKIKLGNLRGNRFKLRIRSVTDDADFAKRAELIRQGVPNYFGEQRFGQQGNNLISGLAMLNGELEERQRVKRGLYISAVRSQLFNKLLAARLREDLWDDLLEGDVLIEPYTQRCQLWDADNAAQQQSFTQREQVLSAPLWGRGELYSQSSAREFEQQQMSVYSDICQQLEELGLRQERRAALLVPQGLELNQAAEGEWELEFSLPAGSFATSVLRELCHWS